ncbi:hypothetical protein ACFXGA_09545 [Actinosynnema sp. NPDC059335]|uniref:hypothetical protein n=1 Tax=Actinosynnema sp. NPDC059335 TaxID=3346804 RepID=UPI00366D404F
MERLAERSSDAQARYDAIADPVSRVWQPKHNSWLYTGRNGVSVAVNKDGTFRTIFHPRDFDK